MAACEAGRQLDAALEALDKMRAAGVPRDAYTYSTLISCCYQVRNTPSRCYAVLKQPAAAATRSDLLFSPIDVLVTTCSLYPPPPTLLAGPLMQAGGQLPLALRLFEEMQAEGVAPNRVVINALLSVCAAEGDADAAGHVYACMTGALGLAPDEITMHCLVEAAGRQQRWLEGLQYFVGGHRLGRYQNVVASLDLEADPVAGM